MVGKRKPRDMDGEFHSFTGDRITVKDEFQPTRPAEETFTTFSDCVTSSNNRSRGSATELCT